MILAAETIPSNRTAFIFGGEGFIGRHLQHLLIELGYAVSILDLKSADSNTRSSTFCDVRLPINLDVDFPPDLVINLAAVHRTPGHSSSEYYETNILGALNVTKWCDDVNAKNLIFTSSIAVYGQSEREIDEDGLLNPTSDYGKSKAIAERIHQDWLEQGEDRKLTICRPAVIFGPGERGNFTRLAKALKGKYFIYPNGGDTLKACGYVKDLVLALIFGCQLDENLTIFNFAYPTTYSISEICSSFSKVAGFSMPRSLPLKTLADELTRFSGPLGDLGKRIMKLTLATSILPNKLIQEGFVWESTLESALSDWYRESTFDFLK